MTRKIMMFGLVAAAAMAQPVYAGNAHSGPTVGNCISDGFYGNEPNMADSSAGGPAEQTFATLVGRYHEPMLTLAACMLHRALETLDDPGPHRAQIGPELEVRPLEREERLAVRGEDPAQPGDPATQDEHAVQERAARIGSAVTVRAASRRRGRLCMICSAPSTRQ